MTISQDKVEKALAVFIYRNKGKINAEEIAHALQVWVDGFTPYALQFGTETKLTKGRRIQVAGIRDNDGAHFFQLTLKDHGGVIDSSGVIRLETFADDQGD